MIYLDYNAGAPLRPEAQARMQALFALVGNASSVHHFGRAAKAVLEEARLDVANLVGARARDVVFTSGASEANVTALCHSGPMGGAPRHILIASSEHESALAGARKAALSGATIDYIPILASGYIDLEALEKLLQIAAKAAPEATLLSVMYANNETGVIQPIADIAALAKRFGVKFHCDLAQAAGKIPLHMADIGADYISLSSHKLGGPQGMGALIAAPQAPLAPLIPGGGQELGRRAGTENILGAAGFAAAAKASMGAFEHDKIYASWRDDLEAHLLAQSDDIVIAGRTSKRLGHVSCLLLDGVRGETQVMHMDLAGLAVSSGSACSSGKVRPSHVLTAMGFRTEQAISSIRLSFGFASKKEDSDEFIKAYEALLKRLKK